MKTIRSTVPARAVLGCAVAAALAAWSPAQARVTRIIIDVKTSPAAGLAPFGAAGAYETLSGRAFGELDPRNDLNQIITDIGLAKDPDGKVRYVTSFFIVKPVDMTKASGLMWHDVPNRGGRITITPDVRGLGDIGLSSGWQGDNAGNTAVPDYADDPLPHPAIIANREWVRVPVAHKPDGSTITGKVLARIVNRDGPQSRALTVMANPFPYKPATLHTSQATLVTRDRDTMEGVVTAETPIPR